MAYKFQLGSARLSGSTTFEQALVGESSISASAALQGASLAADGAAVLGGSLTAVGVVAGGAISSATSIDGSGDLTMGTITMTGFAVDADGDTNLKSLRVDDNSYIGSDSVTDLIQLQSDGDIIIKDGAYDFDIASHDGTNGLLLGGTLVTSTAAELNYVDVTAGTAAASKAVVLDASKDVAGLNDVSAAGLTLSDLTSGRVLVAGASGILADNADLQYDGTSLIVRSKGGAGSNYRSFGTVTGSIAVANAAENGYLAFLGYDGAISGSGNITTAAGVYSNTNIEAKGNLSASANLELAGASVITAPGVNLNNADLVQIDGITPGTALASKALIVNGAKDITGINNLTASYFKGNGSGITNINVSNLDAVGSDTQVQFNQNGEFGAAAGFTFDGTGSVTTSVKVSSAAMEASAAITAGTSFIIGSADLNEADMEKLDGITNGTAAASKAVVLDASKDIAGLNDVSAAGLTLSDLTTGRLPLISTSGLLTSDAAFGYETDREEMEGYVSLYVSSSASGSAYLADGLLLIADTTDSDIFVVNASAVTIGDDAINFGISNGNIQTKAAATLSLDAGTTAINSAELNVLDSVTAGTAAASKAVVLDASKNIATIGTVGCGAVTSTGASSFGNMTFNGTLNAGSLGTAVIDLTADLMIINDGAAGVIKNTSLANYATALAAGSLEGLASTAGRLELSMTNVAAAVINVAGDSFCFIDSNDSNATRKESIADFVGLIAGTGITATAGVLSVSAQSTPTAFTNTNVTLVEGLNYASATWDGAYTLTLPDSDDLDVGEFVKIKMAAGVTSGNSASVVISVGSGDLIDGDASIVLESPYAAVNLYKVDTNVWRIL